MMEAHLHAGGYFEVTANMKGETDAEVAEYVMKHADTSGLRGPTISTVSIRWRRLFAVTVMVEEDRLLSAVSRFER